MGKKKKKVLPRHVQLSPRKSQKRYIKWTTGTAKTQAKMLKKASRKTRGR